MANEKNIHKLKKSSAYSFSVTIPKEIVEKYKWREKQKLAVIDKGRGKVEISDWRKSY
jgi:bifunctional DNA-binding transcriptional regulator/antitoxin component of YhaV-PrlF toxin-antitoxin module